MYEPKTYRHQIKDTDLISFTVAIKETDLYIRAHSDLSREAFAAVSKLRSAIERYIERHPLFLTSLKPLSVAGNSPLIVREMSSAAKTVSIGPMAAVAGAIAEFVGRDLLDVSPEVIVENGGDIFIKTSRKRLVGIYAGESPLTHRIALEINPEDTPLGICTSSGTVGHSLSFGMADAVIVLSSRTALADASATAVGNLIRTVADIDSGIEFAQQIDGVKGVVIIKDDKIGMWGDLKITSVN